MAEKFVEQRVERVAGEPGRYYVASANGPVLVDICALKGNGWCGCEDFAFRHQPAWQRGEPGRHRCKHIIAAMLFECEEGIKVWNLAHPQDEVT